MKIDNNVLIIDEALNDENIEELILAVNQDEIDTVNVLNDELSSGILQVLWCSGKIIDVESEFLSKFFDNVKGIN